MPRQPKNKAAEAPKPVIAAPPPVAAAPAKAPPVIDVDNFIRVRDSVSSTRSHHPRLTLGPYLPLTSPLPIPSRATRCFQAHRDKLRGAAQLLIHNAALLTYRVALQLMLPGGEQMTASAPASDLMRNISISAAVQHSRSPRLAHSPTTHFIPPRLFTLPRICVCVSA